MSGLVIRPFMKDSAISLPLRASPAKDVVVGTTPSALDGVRGTRLCATIRSGAGGSQSSFLAASRLMVVRLTLMPASNKARRMAENV